MVSPLTKTRTALAVFVKTPTLSPIKTRLAADIGYEKSLRIYEQLLLSTADLLKQLLQQGIVNNAYWAVAESSALDDEQWSAYPRLWTGEGGLGKRLSHIYDSLSGEYDRVILIGADAPQLTAALIKQAAQESGVVIGPARDGGFYLFAASRPIDAAVWQGVEYSCATTREQLQDALNETAILHLPPLTDIDDEDSLHAALGELAISQRQAFTKIIEDD